MNKTARETVQPTNERYDGGAGLYDVLVGTRDALQLTEVGGQGECYEYGEGGWSGGPSAGESLGLCLSGWAAPLLSPL